MSDLVNKLEIQLGSFDESSRRQALNRLKMMADKGDIEFAQPGNYTNMHFHTFHSFNAEREIEKLLEIAMQTGVEAANIIPDRNYTPGLGQKDEKCENLYKFINVCNKLSLPIITGTEMNRPGQKFVDNFESDELKPLVPVFLKGALIIYAHSVMQRECGLGYLSNWAKTNFDSRAKKNVFFEKIGSMLSGENEKLLADLSEEAKPQDILKKITT